MNVSHIKAILEQVAGSAVEEISVTSEGVAVHIRFAAFQDCAETGRATESVARAEASADTIEIAAEMPGIVYLAPAPGEAAFVSPGERVAAGQTLLLIEAMKSMVPVAAPVDAIVTEIYIGEEASCEAGQVLVVLRREVA